MKATATNTDTLQSEETEVLTLTENTCRLIVWNDEVNTFEWVIETLMEVYHPFPGQICSKEWPLR